MELNTLINVIWERAFNLLVLSENITSQFPIWIKGVVGDGSQIKTILKLSARATYHCQPLFNKY